ncbi:hypothetical protein KUV26_22135 [Leisingera daeponensis]|uniref:Uncharacterized protein n=1 Tax=Leisingera daeponensis TaxID=405746 RepID=A0ABS7NLT5_9RHOB|nr:hypothetical protein [Leisingera daeponensis]MBY6142142.1 hypothetical protein [Leisingera daeponensis]
MFRRGCPGAPGSGGAGILTGSLLIFELAALAEFAGCFALWEWLRLDRSPLWLVPGIASLVLFAYLLTRADSAFAGRACAAYGGIYIASSIHWMWLAKGNCSDR